MYQVESGRFVTWGRWVSVGLREGVQRGRCCGGHAVGVVVERSSSPLSQCHVCVSGVLCWRDSQVSRVRVPGRVVLVRVQ